MNVTCVATTTTKQSESFFFFQKNLASFCATTDSPCFGFLVTSPVGFKARLGSPMPFFLSCVLITGETHYCTTVSTNQCSCKVHNIKQKRLVLLMFFYVNRFVAKSNINE